MSYHAPVKEMLFVMESLAGLPKIAALPGFEDFGAETAQAVLEESAKFCEGVIAPLNWEGDKNPSTWKDGVVTTTPGFKEAFAQFAQGGWQGVIHPADDYRVKNARKRQISVAIPLIEGLDPNASVLR